MKRLVLIAVLSSSALVAMEPVEGTKPATKQEAKSALALIMAERHELEKQLDGEERTTIVDGNKQWVKIAKSRVKILKKDIEAKKKQEAKLIDKLAK